MVGSCLYNLQKHQLMATYWLLNCMTYQSNARIAFLTVGSPWMMHVFDHSYWTVGEGSYSHLMMRSPSGPRSVTNLPFMTTVLQYPTWRHTASTAISTRVPRIPMAHSTYTIRHPWLQVLLHLLWRNMYKHSSSRFIPRVHQSINCKILVSTVLHCLFVCLSICEFGMNSIMKSKEMNDSNAT